MINSTYIFLLKNPDFQKNSTCWFYCQIVCYFRKKLSIDLGSLGSHQLLQLQLFPKVFKILDPPFNFILPGFVQECWNLVFLCYKFGSFEDGLRLSVQHFQKLNDYLLFADAFGLNSKFWFVDNFLFAVGSLLNNESGSQSSTQPPLRKLNSYRFLIEIRDDPIKT